MKASLVVLLAALLMVAPGAARGGPAQKTVEVYIVTPAAYTSTVTPEQAAAVVPGWLDEINAWFSREIGKTFRYSVTIFPLADAFTVVDECGTIRDSGDLYPTVTGRLKDAGVDFRNGRVMILVMGAGGWAGHFSPTDRGVNAAGMVGDWGVMEAFDARDACVPDWDYPNRGFSHEFAGMMGMYVSDGYNGALFVGDVMTAKNKADLLKYSAKWLG